MFISFFCHKKTKTKDCLFWLHGIGNKSEQEVSLLNCAADTEDSKNTFRTYNYKCCQITFWFFFFKISGNLSFRKNECLAL